MRCSSAREFRIDRAERDQHPGPIALAVRREATVHPGDVFVQKALEASSPSLDDAASPEQGNELRRFIPSQSPEGPAREADVHVDDHAG
jgi:hypothetical protein